jgi:hypothetical protein
LQAALCTHIGQRNGRSLKSGSYVAARGVTCQSRIAENEGRKAIERSD